MQSSKEYADYTQIIKNDTYVKNKIYIDIGMIKDLSIGALVSKIEENEYNKLISIIKTKEYENRINNNFSLKTIEKDISDNELFTNSPIINYYNFIFELIQVIKSNKQMIEGNRDIDVTINFYPLNIDVKIRDAITNYIGKQLGVSINSIVNKIDINYLFRYDCLFIYNFDELSKLIDDIFTEDEIYNFNLLTKYTDIDIFTPRLIHTEITKSVEKIIKDFDFCSLYMNLIFNFHFLPPSIPI